MEIWRLAPGDEELVRAADALFDDPSDPAAVRAFLANPQNTLLIAYVEEKPAGFISGHELQRLDSTRPMIFLYEVGVAEAFRGRGIGTALVRALAGRAEEGGAGEMFVLTNEANEPAMRMYAAAGGVRNEDRDIAMFEWHY
jgi:ribosomal protein S18 acetylase RimI-like enzyme